MRHLDRNLELTVGRLFLALLLCLSPLVARCETGVVPTVAFVHVNVVPMDRDRVLTDQTVIVRDGRVEAIGSDLTVPEGALIIDGGRTAYLSPGLADMHTHSETPNDLALYLAAGVTTVLHMGGARAAFVDSIVPAVNGGSLPGPHVYTSFKVDGSTRYNGFVIKTPNEARAMVGLAKSNGYDFIKVYVDLSPEVFSVLAQESKRLAMPLVGHGVYSVRLERQLLEGQALVAHAEEFFYSFFTPPGVEESDTPPAADRIPSAVALAKRFNVAVTADVATYAAIAHQIGRKEVLDSYLARPSASYLSPSDRLAWQNTGYLSKTARLEPKLAFMRKLVKSMAEADVELVTGTDAPTVPGMTPGFSLHENIAELEATGLTRFQALSAATRAPGNFIHRTKGGDRFGTVTVGARADLILSKANPLAELATLRAPLGVMAKGRWQDSIALRKLTDRVLRDHQGACQRPMTGS